MVELAEAEAGLAEVLEALSFDPGRLEQVEERLFAIRALARKHGVQPDELAALLGPGWRRGWPSSTRPGNASTRSPPRPRRRPRAYDEAAAALSAARRAAATALDAAVTAELAPLRMEAARFLTEIAPGEPGPDGADQVRFTAAINAGAPAGPIDRIASGGELSRFLLALKVRLAGRAERADDDLRRDRPRRRRRDRRCRRPPAGAPRPLAPGAGGDAQPAGGGARATITCASPRPATAR